MPSDTTVTRTFHEIYASTRAALPEAVAEVRAEVWRRSSATKGTDPVVLDIDASLVEIHSENKELAAPTYKGGYGFHPMFCFADLTGETLSGLLRPGNAGANTVADHVSVLDAGVAQLPAEIALATTSATILSSSGARSSCGPTRRAAPKGFLSACRERNVGFFVAARSNPQVTAAIFDAIGVERGVAAALSPRTARTRTGACVAELTSLIDGPQAPRRHPAHRPT